MNHVYEGDHCHQVIVGNRLNHCCWLLILSITDMVRPVFVINGAEGVEVGTEMAWGIAAREAIPTMFLINHLDPNFQLQL